MRAQSGTAIPILAHTSIATVVKWPGVGSHYYAPNGQRTFYNYAPDQQYFICQVKSACDYVKGPASGAPAGH